MFSKIVLTVGQLIEMAPQQVFIMLLRAVFEIGGQELI